MKSIQTAAVALILLTTGCSLFPEGRQPPIHFFDIGFPEANPVPGTTLVIQRFRQSGPFGERMVFRDSANTLRVDEFNRWSDRPDELLRRYLTLAFGGETAPNEDQVSLILSGNLLRFDMDLNDQTANVIIETELKTIDDRVLARRVIRQKASADENNASSYARAMERAVHNLFSTIRRDVAEAK